MSPAQATSVAALKRRLFLATRLAYRRGSEPEVRHMVIVRLTREGFYMKPPGPSKADPLFVPWPRRGELEWDGGPSFKTTFLDLVRHFTIED